MSGKNSGLLCEHSLEITDDELVESTDAGGTTINLDVRGDHFGRETLEQLMRDFVEAQGDGFTLVTT